MQTAEQYAQIISLCEQHGLAASDLWQHKQSGHWILSRTGVEKIIAKSRITVKLDMVGCGVDFAVIKATATLPTTAGGMYANTPVGIESFGSAQPGNVAPKFTYFAEMAEKRAKGRAVLQLMGFYQLGVYSEDEAPAFQQAANVAPAVAAPAPVTTQPAPVQYALASQKEQIITLLASPMVTREEKNRMLLNINRLDVERASTAIANLTTVIAEREQAQSI